MDESKNTKITVPAVIVLYDFEYTAKDKREISMRKGEKLFLIEKTNKDWWQVVRQSERRSFYVPAQYVEIIPKERLPIEHLNFSSGNKQNERIDYENLNPSNVKHRDVISNRKQNPGPNTGVSSRIETEILKQAQVNKQKPIPKTRTKVSGSRVSSDSAAKLVSDSKVPPGGSEGDSRHDRPRYGEKKATDLSLSLPKNSNQLTNLLDQSESLLTQVEERELNRLSKSRNAPKPRLRASCNFPENEQIDSNKNRMKSSYNLRVKPSKSFEVHHKSPMKYRKKESAPPFKTDNRNLSQSLEKLAQEIKFQPKEVEKTNVTVPPLTHHSESDESCNKIRSKPKDESIPKNNVDKKVAKGDDQGLQAQSKGSVFKRLRRSLHHSSSFKSTNAKKLSKSDNRGCELSLSWEGGLDKALELENNKKPQITLSGLQRSRTFMVAERSPTVFRHGSSIYKGKNRLDIAYHLQSQPGGKNVLSSFKPIRKIEEVNVDDKPEHSNEGGSPRPVTKRIDEAEVKRDVKDSHAGEDCARCDDDGVTYENVGVWSMEVKSPMLSSELYSQSESEDNAETKMSTSADARDEACRNRGLTDLSVTHSEGTELSESDENGSLDVDAEKHSKMKEPLSKRRTSLMRNRRVSTAKSRTVTAWQLPPTPNPEDKSTKDLGNGWGEYVFDDKRNFYYNKITGEKSWKPPRRNLSNQDSRYVGSRESICSDTSGSIIRSSTSSPSNERILTNSFNRSNASLSSRSTGCDNSGYDLTKSSSGCNLREDIIQNRSSLTSSPATGQSRSSSYSVIKSSRDSLNRCSPIENIPSEEDDLELHDHVYKENIKEESQDELSEAASEEEFRLRTGEREENLLDEDERPTTGVSIPPGWTEHYDDFTSQFYYVHKQTNQKWFTSFDPEGRLYFFDELSNESSWALPDINSDGQDLNYIIQRSATESAIQKGPKDLVSDGDKRRNRVSSTRSSKTQSMVIEGKLDFSIKDDGKTLSMPRDLTKIYGEIIRSGMLNKTKICENGKKLRKNWTPAFVVLSNTKLLFFKDAKTFHSMVREKA